MEKKEILKGLLMMLKDLKENAEAHSFDANSDKCKYCEGLINIFDSIIFIKLL